MDAFEQMAVDLELAQTARFRKHGGDTSEFWNDTETAIFDQIKALREKSSTFNFDNVR